MLPKKNKEQQKRETQKKEKPFGLKVKKFSIQKGRVDFIDNALKPRQKFKLDRIYFTAKNIDMQEKTWLQYYTSMRFNSQARIKSHGSIRHTPFRQKGSFDVKNIPLVAFNPYIQEKSYLDIYDGRLSFKGNTLYSKSARKPDLRVQSSFSLNSLFINDIRDDSALFSVDTIKTDALTFELSPNRLYINELDINAFFINAMIDANKSMNFAQLMKEDTTKTRLKTQKLKEDEQESFPVDIAKVNVTLGSAKFSDYSIPIRFYTHIHDLDGVIYSISNTAEGTSYMNIAGEVDKYGSTKLKGSIDSTNPKAYTDLDLSFQNIALNSVSGYSATFAGHEIDGGKLYLDLSYDIADSKLMSTNNVMIKNIELGETSKDENVTVLPLGFVVGLLEDSDGIIDIDMPVEGDVNNPEFKYGNLIWKTISSLVTDAVTSPFRFLGSVMGIDTSELEYIEFEGGKSMVSPPQREKLDQVAKMMLKKPKITLKVSATYDKKIDLEALKLEKLIDLVMLKSGLKNRKEHESAMNIDLLEEIYEEQENTKDLEIIQKELEEKYSDGEYKREYQKYLVLLCRDIQEVSLKELEILAKKRSQNIIKYLSLEKNIAPKRLEQSGLIVTQRDIKDVKLSLEIGVE